MSDLKQAYAIIELGRAPGFIQDCSLIRSRYHQICLQHLIPVLNDESAVLNENIVASTVILRYLEEIGLSVFGYPHPNGPNHLIGARIFLSTTYSSASNNLRSAAFWLGLRQEVVFAVANQRATTPNLDHCDIDRSLGLAHDGTWANR